MPVGVSAQAAAISAPRRAAKRDGVAGGQRAGHGGGGQLADAVPGDDALAGDVELS